jgi:hypothetical protein
MSAKRVDGAKSLIPPTTTSGSAKYSERSFTSRWASKNRVPADKVIDVDDERLHGHYRTGGPLYRFTEPLADFNDPA